MHVIPAQQWWPAAQNHERAARSRSAAHEERRRRGQRHALEDFLWEYYPLRPGRFATWHPGFVNGEPQALLSPFASGMDDADAVRWYTKRAGLPWHCEVNTDDGPAITIDPAFVNHRAKGIRHLASLHQILLRRDAVFGCLGWHEWAMVYEADETRHPLPLRLGAERTNDIVRQAHIRCTHFDAFRFFTDAGRPLNQLQPSYETVLENEQPGCIHVTMDLLRACIQLGPIVRGDLMIAAYDLALKARTIDMQASPYDCSGFGLAPIKIETQEGKAHYIAAQRELSAQARPLRERLLEVLLPVRERLDHQAAVV